MPKRIDLREEDLRLFEELGLSRGRTLDTIQKEVNSLSIRELDKLKIVLSMLAREKHFPAGLNKGIRGNDLRAFSRAVLSLNNEYS